MKTSLLLGIALSAASTLCAGGDSTKTAVSDTLEKREFQISFITPMGTNGMEYNNIENQVSVNIFGGHHGGLNGIEVAGFANSIRKDAKGLQIAGFANSVQGQTTGSQISGFANYTGKLEGMQAAGFSNVSKDSVQGGQVAGFANYAHNYHEGIQAAGFSNTVKGNAKGIYGAGFNNTVTGTMEGIQGSGFVNVAHKGVKGAQIAGFANYCTDTVKGVQLSGFMNIAGKLSGVQVGFINYSDTIQEGTMIGFLSFSRKGYHALELEGNESLYGNLTFKTGTNQFYNILSVGVKPNQDQMFWGFGYGVGTMIQFKEKFGMNIDLTANHINKDEGFTAQLNLLNKLKPSVYYSFHDHFTVYGGPSFNVLVSGTNIYGESPQNDGLINEMIYDKNINDVNVKMYLGFQAGMRF